MSALNFLGYILLFTVMDISTTKLQLPSGKFPALEIAGGDRLKRISTSQDKKPYLMKILQPKKSDVIRLNGGGWNPATDKPKLKGILRNPTTPKKSPDSLSDGSAVDSADYPWSPDAAKGFRRSPKSLPRDMEVDAGSNGGRSSEWTEACKPGESDDGVLNLGESFSISDGDGAADADVAMASPSSSSGRGSVPSKKKG
jgi:hypothetical protein